MNTKLLFLSFIVAISATQCHIRSSNIINKYPDASNYVYAIDFDTSIMQANYVYYISTSGGNSCSNCGHFRMDPYGINILKDDDYKYTGYDRGHVCTNADYGKSTFVISNVVPMLPSFNQGPWRISEEFIRKNYSGKLVYKGCDYSDFYIITSLDNKLYIPIGCYYVIFDIETLPNPSEFVVGEILDYGYYPNKNLSTYESRLPSWIVCDSIDTYEYLTAVIGVVVGLTSVFGVIVIFAMLYRRFTHNRSYAIL
jgi:DNA/RNA endonuclease G (NUC1)